MRNVNLSSGKRQSEYLWDSHCQLPSSPSPPPPSSYNRKVSQLHSTALVFFTSFTKIREMKPIEWIKMLVEFLRYEISQIIHSFSSSSLAHTQYWRCSFFFFVHRLTSLFFPTIPSMVSRGNTTRDSRYLLTKPQDFFRFLIAFSLGCVSSSSTLLYRIWCTLLWCRGVIVSWFRI